MKARRITDDLTTGSIRIQFLVLAAPLIAGNILQQFYNMADSYIAGHYISANAFAAVGLAGNIVNLVIFMIVGCCSGITVICSQMYGEKNWNMMRRETFLSMIAGFVFTGILSLIGITFARPILLLLQTPDVIFDVTHQYLLIILSCLFVTYLYNWSASILQSFGNSGTSLCILACAVCTNIVLDMVFVIILKWGIAGTAFATVISQLLSSIVALIYLFKTYPMLRLHRKDLVMDIRLLNKTICFGLVSALHQSSLYIGKLLIQGLVNHAGIDSLTAFTAATRLESLSNSFSDSGCIALSIIVGQCYGAEQKERIHKALFQCMQIMIVFCIPLCVLMASTARLFTVLLIGNASAAVISQSFHYLMTVSCFYVFCFIGSTFVGFYKGIGMVHVPVYGTIVQMTFRILISWLLINHIGLPAVAIGTGIGWMAINIYQSLLFRFSKRVHTVINAP